MSNEESFFGLKMGMSLEEVKTACKGMIAKISFEGLHAYAIMPNKRESCFEKYIVRIDDPGLYFIEAFSDDILSTSLEGIELRNEFDCWVKRLSEKYGKPGITDSWINFKDDFKENEWLLALKECKAELGALWKAGKSAISDTLDEMYLQALPKKHERRDKEGLDMSGMIALCFYFKNSNECDLMKQFNELMRKKSNLD